MEFPKYNKIKQIGHKDNKLLFSDPNQEIIIEEKIDGANFRIGFNENGAIIYGSRNRELTDKDKMFNRCIDFVDSLIIESGIDVSNLNGYILIGENCIRHTINYDWEKIPPFIGFDVYSIDTQKYIPYDNRCHIFEEFNLPIVPLINRTMANEIENINDGCVPRSNFGNIKAEGVVFKNYDLQIMGKYVRQQFKEENKNIFGKSRKDASNDTELIVAKFCPIARINKGIFRMVEDGYNLDMKMMSILPNSVYEDMIEECYPQIMYGNYSINTREIRKQIAKLCVSTLQQMMTNYALNNE